MAKILIVDDEPDIRFIARKILEKAGHSVIEAESGASCLQRLEDEHFDLILLDVVIPDSDGWEVCRRIKVNGKTKHIPVVMFTVRAQEEDVERSRECGAEAHISKPFEIRELLRTVERVLNARGKV
ncbi:MAG: response regulator [Euryarchaeota archaeon]|nr:response regulator [Euryarchaeota archaeon]